MLPETLARAVRSHFTAPTAKAQRVMAKHRAERKCGLSRDFRLNNLSVVVPVYRSEYTLEKLCASLQETLPLEIIFVEDCGGDESWKIIKHLETVEGNVVSADVRKMKSDF